MGDRPRVQGLTVDAGRARELDDAFWVERTPGGFRLTVSIADVASLVPAGGLDDEIAMARGLSVYEPGAPKAAMFSPQIAQGLASLLPGRERPVVAVVAEFDAGGVLVSRMATRASLCSCAKLAYETFDEIFYDRGQALSPVVDASVALAAVLWRNRVAQAGLPDWETAFDAGGALRPNIAPGQLAQTVIHEFMVEVNALSTDIVRAAAMPMVYRNQGPRAGGPTGRYEIVCHGHAALGKAAYGQFSSPIRRFTDLVNQRVLCAAVEGARPPYDLGELAYVCAASNRATQRAECLSRKMHEGEGDAPRAAPPMERLDSTGFRNLLAQAPALDEATAREVARRADDGLLTHSDVAWLLFGADSPADDSLRCDLLHRMSANAHEAARVWECAFNEQGLPMFEGLVQRAAAEGGWVAAAAVGRHVGDAADPDPIRARGLAVLDLAARVCRVAMPDVPLAPGPGLRMADMLCKAKLVALCRLMSWSGPEYRIEAQGAGARHHFRGTARIGVDDFDYETPLVHASTRKGAESAAATLALTALDPYADHLLRREAIAYGIDFGMLEGGEARDRPLAVLSDFCRRYRAEQRFVWLVERPTRSRFECVLEVVAAGTVLRARGVGSSRPEAMEDGARGAMASILDLASQRDREDVPSASAATVQVSP